MAYVYREYRTHGKPWCIAYKGVDGRLRRERTDAPTKELARKLLSRRLVEVTEAKVAGLKAEPSRITFSEFMPEFVSHVKATKSPGMIRSVRTSLRQLEPAFGSRQLREINSGLVQKYVDGRRLQKRRNGRMLRAATVNRELMCLSALFREAIKREIVERNPCRGVKQLAEQNEIVRCLEPDEETRLLVACSGDLRPIVICALHTGMRRGEILGLQWEDVDLSSRLIRVRFTKNRRIRYIPINDLLLETLQSLVRYEGCPYVFANPDSRTRWCDQKLGWAAAIRKSGVKNFRFHDLRHTFASRLVRAGASLQIVRELLGHATLQMTLRYAHLAPNDLRNAVAVLCRKVDERSVS